MEQKQLNSDHLESAGYDEKTQELSIIFKDGSEYIYDEVPESAYVALFQVSSPSAYFRASIKGHYTFYKVQ